MKMDQPWSTGCCDCFDDCGICFTTCCVPCITYGQIAQAHRGGDFVGPCLVYTTLLCCIGCTCCVTGGMRTDIRRKYGLKEDPMSDCLIHWPCCEVCALCQEARELKHRGVLGAV